MKSDQEIELKLEIEDVNEIKQKLEVLGATLAGETQQEDVLFLHKFMDFKQHDQALRLRSETNEQGTHAELTWKGTPTHTADGHKIRDEYTSPVDSTQIKKILKELSIEDRYTINKKRTTYNLGNIEAALDELSFGNYLELEGPATDIEPLREKLGLQDSKPVTEGYIFIQWRHEGNDPDDLGKW